VSRELLIDNGPATSPTLCASFIRILGVEGVQTLAEATSELYYVLKGAGQTTHDNEVVEWSQGDVLVLPGGSRNNHTAAADSVLYWVTDAPLLAYLGVAPVTESAWVS
jgi:gentisate 1,2-dioxygenase